MKVKRAVLQFMFRFIFSMNGFGLEVLIVFMYLGKGLFVIQLCYLYFLEIMLSKTNEIK